MGIRDRSQDLSHADEQRLRKAFFEGWREEAPALARSSKALDSHKGGVPIWEYEQVLEEAASALAWGKEVPPRTGWWLDHVSRIHNQRERVLARLHPSQAVQSVPIRENT